MAEEDDEKNTATTYYYVHTTTIPVDIFIPVSSLPNLYLYNYSIYYNEACARVTKNVFLCRNHVECVGVRRRHRMSVVSQASNKTKNVFSSVPGEET